MLSKRLKVNGMEIVKSHIVYLKPGNLMVQVGMSGGAVQNVRFDTQADMDAFIKKVK